MNVASVIGQLFLPGRSVSSWENPSSSTNQRAASEFVVVVEQRVGHLVLQGTGVST